MIRSWAPSQLLLTLEIFTSSIGTKAKSVNDSLIRSRAPPASLLLSTQSFLARCTPFLTARTEVGSGPSLEFPVASFRYKIHLSMLVDLECLHLFLVLCRWEMNHLKLFINVSWLTLAVTSGSQREAYELYQMSWKSVLHTQSSALWMLI